MDFCFRKLLPLTPKCFVKAILNYFIGNYLTEELDEDQIQLIGDQAQCSNINIKIKVINDNFEKQNIPLNLLYGYIGCIRFNLPARSSNGKLIIEVKDLELSIGPAPRNATPDPNVFFGSMVDSMVFMQKSLQDESFSDLIFEEKHKGKNFNALISKWISKLSVQFQNVKISFETRPIEQINRCCRFLCEIERIDFATLDTDSLNLDSATIMGILLKNNIEFSGFTIRWEVAVQSTESTSELMSMSNSSNIILYGCQILSVSSSIQMSYTLLISNSEPQLEINFNVDTVHLLLAPLPIHWIAVLISQISISKEDASISRNVRMTESQFESFFPIEERLISSFKSQNQESLYHSILESSIQNTYDDVSLDNSDDDDQFPEFQNDTATCASIASTMSMFDDEGKMNTNFKATMFMKCFCLKILLQNPSNDCDTWDLKEESINQRLMPPNKHKEWDSLSTKFFGLLKTVDKCSESFASLEKFHNESGDLDYLSLFVSNFMCSMLTKKFNDILHRKFELTTGHLLFSEALYNDFNSRNYEDSFQIVSVIGTYDDINSKESKAIDMKLEYSSVKKEISLEVKVGKCCVALDISLQDRIRLLTQNDLMNYNISEGLNHSLESKKSVDLKFNCITVLNISELCLNVFVPVVNLNDEMHSKSFWKYRYLHPESLQLNMKNGRLLFRVIAGGSENFHQDCIELYTNSVLMCFSSQSVKDLPILNIINDVEDCPPIMIIKIKSKLAQSLEDREFCSYNTDVSFPYNPKYKKKCFNKPYSTKESAKNNASSKIIYTPLEDAKINQYIENSISNSYFDIEIRASAFLLLVSDKKILEIIYHRLAFDLLLWESNFDKRNNGVFINFKPQDDETDDEVNTDTSVEEELNVPKQKSGNRIFSKKFTLNMKVDWARLYFQILLGHISETVIGLNQVTVFTDSDIVQGLVESKSMFITRIEKLKIFFSDEPLCDENDQKLQNKDFILTDKYFCVIDEVPETLISHHLVNDCPSHMLVFILDTSLTKFKKTKQNSKLKEKAINVVTAQINRLCLRHNYIFDANNGFRWLICMTEFLALNNPVITGYTLPDSDTKIYLHSANCAMDLCFSHFPMAVISTFNKIEIEIISNVTESYHLNVESSFIGSQIFVRSNDNTQLSAYFCWKNASWFPISMADNGLCSVVDLDNLDVRFKKIGSNNSEKEPTCNFVVTNSQINVHLCSDSLNLIINCLSKIFSSVVTENSDDQNVPIVIPSLSKQHSDPIQIQNESTASLNESEKTQFNNMINDAMKEDRFSIKRSKKKSDEFCDGFLLVDDIFSNIHDRVVSLENSPNQKLSVVPDHYKIPSTEDLCFKKKKSIYKDPDGYPECHNSIVVHDFSISFYFYGGSDLTDKNTSQSTVGSFQTGKSRELPSVKFQRFKSDVKSQISIQTVDTDAAQLENNSISKYSNRKLKEAYQWKFRKINFRYALFSNIDWRKAIYQQISRRLVFTIKDVTLISHNTNSKINMVLFCDSNAKNWYDPNSPMVSFKVIFIQSNPNQDVVNEECDIKLSIQPIMLNIDQDFVLFVEKFYKDLNTKELLNLGTADPRYRQNSTSSVLSESSHQEKDSILIPPNKNINKELVMGRGGGIDSIAGSSPLSRASTIRLPAFDEMRSKKEDVDSTPPMETSKSLSSIFIRRFSLYPDVYIRLDYTGTRLDFTQGALKGFLYILIQLNNVVLIIKNKQYLEGITGFDVFLQILAKEIYDEFVAQINKFITKVGPISEISEMLSGIYDFFCLPYQYYHNERGIIEGIKLGTRSITTTSLWATLTLLSKGLRIFQKMAETTYDLVSPSTGIHDEEAQQLARDFREGVTNAAFGVRRRLNNTAQDIQVALQRPDRPIISRVGDVIRQGPHVIAGPIVATCEASNQLIDGLRYQLKPEMKIEDEKKWKY